MKLLAIAPSWQPTLWHGGKVPVPPMSLPTLAALTPPGAAIHLVDENVEAVALDEPADLVAISSLTAAAPRGYQIARAFRDRGIPVVMGGIHPSVLPEEAAEHADAVVIGEAEGLWPKVLADFAAGRPQRFYRSEAAPDLAGLPFPRRDLLHAERYLTVNLVQTARGCPQACSFCSVTSVFGRRVRFRPVPEVVEEVRSLGARVVGFTDDNIVAHPTRAKELFEALIPLKLRWVGQGDLTAAKDEELLKLMARSGCHAILMGLESLSPESLAAARKRSNMGVDYERALATIHRHGIDLIGCFVFGFDPDGPGVFRETVDLAERVRLAVGQFTVLTPFPGTRLYEELKAEGRLLTEDWSRYHMGEVVFQPRNMTAAELQQGRAYALHRFYSLGSILRRMLVWRGGRPRWGLRMVVNLSYRRLTLGGRITNRIPGDVRRPPSGGLPAPVAQPTPSVPSV